MPGQATAPLKGAANAAGSALGQTVATVGDHAAPVMQTAAGAPVAGAVVGTAEAILSGAGQALAKSTGPAAPSPGNGG
jgi:hypothetical protein